MYTVWISGGRDSIAALFRVLERSHDGVLLAHIDELSAFADPENPQSLERLKESIRKRYGMLPADYVEYVAKSLRLELKIVRPQHNFWELTSRYGYPGLYYRWCYRHLQEEPMVRFRLWEVRSGREKAVWVSGVRKHESAFRERVYGEQFSENDIVTISDRGGLKFRVRVWRPVFLWSDEQVREYVDKKLKEYGLEPNPWWRFNFSMECLCGAGASLSTYRQIATDAPELSRYLAAMDKKVRIKIRRNDIAPPALRQKGITLSDFLEGVERTTLAKYLW